MSGKEEEFTDAQKMMMRLSGETLAGLRMTGKCISMNDNIDFIATITVHAFVEVTKYLLTLPGDDSKFLLSERFCQDPVESFFGQQRSKGGHNDNPTVHSFLQNTVSLRIQGTTALNTLRGNCRKRKSDEKIVVDETPLPKRKRKFQS